MKVYWLSINNDGQPIFYSEYVEVEEEAAPTDAAERSGMRAWAETKYKSLHKVLHESEEGTGLRMRRAWEWLQARISPHESLPRSLRSASFVELNYPARVREEEARAAWRSYLGGRWRYHLLWFMINTLISPVTLLLTPFPGPNLIGYWFVYRAVCHLLAMLGVRRARLGAIETRYHSSSALDEILSEGNEAGIALLSDQFELKNLDAFIKRAKAKRINNEDTTLAVP